jgi:hypothetical protein
MLGGEEIARVVDLVRNTRPTYDDLWLTLTHP